jgi:dephospho-CoA kinase
MFVVGITGGIGSGKTAVTDRFAKLGIEIIDADLAARVVVEPGTTALGAIAEHFGSSILLTDGNLDRAALRTRIFSEVAGKKWLENLLHPLIGEEIMHQLAAAQSPYVIFVSPLLLEASQNVLCDRILVVDVPEQTQISRTISRDDNDEAQVRRIISTQLSRQQRLKQASDVIENNEGLAQLAEPIERLHQQYLAMASEKDRKNNDG